MKLVSCDIAGRELEKVHESASRVFLTNLHFKVTRKELTTALERYETTEFVQGILMGEWLG